MDIFQEHGVVLVAEPTYEQAVETADRIHRNTKVRLETFFRCIATPMLEQEIEENGIGVPCCYLFSADRFTFVYGTREEFERMLEDFDREKRSDDYWVLVYRGYVIPGLTILEILERFRRYTQHDYTIDELWMYVQKGTLEVGIATPELVRRAYSNSDRADYLRITKKGRFNVYASLEEVWGKK